MIVRPFHAPSAYDEHIRFTRYWSRRLHCERLRPAHTLPYTPTPSRTALALARLRAAALRPPTASA